MAVVSQIMSPLLIAVAIHMASSFVQLSPSRTRTNSRIERWSPVFSSVANSTLSTASTIDTPIINNGEKQRTYEVGKPEKHKRSVSRNKTNKHNMNAPPATLNNHGIITKAKEISRNTTTIKTTSESQVPENNNSNGSIGYTVNGRIRLPVTSPTKISSSK
jgi:hypothetical protein